MNNADPKPVSARVFDDAERQALYDIIEARRDVRNEFLPDDIEPDALMRILRAAHNAPSVGFMQPWNFILIDDPAQKQKVHAAFADANAEAEQMFSKDRQETYRSLKLEGIKKSPLNIIVTCDRTRGARLFWAAPMMRRWMCIRQFVRFKTFGLRRGPKGSELDGSAFSTKNA